MKLPLIASALAVVLIAFGTIILLPVAVACIEVEYMATIPFLMASILAISLGLLLRWYGRLHRNLDLLKRNEGLLIVTMTWIVCSIIGAVPYLFYGLSPLDALFESVSGITTTGATILVDFSLYSNTFFFWRSLTQWLGGMGIIVLFVAILPQFGVAGRKIFFAEAPGPTEEKFTPVLPILQKLSGLSIFSSPVLKLVHSLLLACPYMMPSVTLSPQWLPAVFRPIHNLSWAIRVLLSHG